MRTIQLRIEHLIFVPFPFPFPSSHVLCRLIPFHPLCHAPPFYLPCPGALSNLFLPALALLLLAEVPWPSSAPPWACINLWNRGIVLGHCGIKGG